MIGEMSGGRTSAKFILDKLADPLHTVGNERSHRQKEGRRPWIKQIARVGLQRVLTHRLPTISDKEIPTWSR